MRVPGVSSETDVAPSGPEASSPRPSLNKQVGQRPSVAPRSKGAPHLPQTDSFGMRPSGFVVGSIESLQQMPKDLTKFQFLRAGHNRPELGPLDRTTPLSRSTLAKAPS